jgi:hypothetical protein
MIRTLTDEVVQGRIDTALPAPQQNPVACRHCGGTTWEWTTKTGIVIPTAVGVHDTVRHATTITKELRCTKCHRKATSREVSAIMGTEAFRIAKHLSRTETDRRSESGQLTGSLIETRDPRPRVEPGG